MTTPDPMADLFAQWKKATDAYMEMWTKAFEQAKQAPGSSEAQREAAATALGAHHATNEVTREAFEPMIALMGGVPLSEFRRLADDVHALHLRMDTVDDRLRRIEALLKEQAPAKRGRGKAQGTG